MLMFEFESVVTVTMTMKIPYEIDRKRYIRGEEEQGEHHHLLRIVIHSLGYGIGRIRAVD